MYQPIETTTSQDIVTFTLYAQEEQMQNPDGSCTSQYSKTFLNERKNIDTIIAKLTQAALDANRTPPKFVLSVLYYQNKFLRY